MRPAEGPEPHGRAPRRQVVSHANFTHTHTPTHARALPHSQSYSNAHTPHTLQYTLADPHTHVLPQTHILSHIRMGPRTSHKLTVTLPFIHPRQHIHPHTVSLILTFIHPHNPIFTATLMLTTPIQAPKYLHSSLLHLTRYSHSSPLHTLADTYMHITHTLQHALILILTHAHHHTLSHTLPPRLRTHGVTRFSSPALTLAHAHLLR